MPLTSSKSFIARAARLKQIADEINKINNERDEINKRFMEKLIVLHNEKSQLHIAQTQATKDSFRLWGQF